jgi:HNH endonuclease
VPTCIYCRSSSSKPYPAEHVIPWSFGHFRNGLTLRCVCGDCNQYFANHLELHFGRETGEGLVRFQYGLRDSVAGLPGSRLTARIKVPGLTFGAKVLLAPNTKTNGIEMVYMPQVAFASENSDDWTWYLPEELNQEVLLSLPPNSQLRYFFASPAELEMLRKRIRELGFSLNTKHVSRTTILPQPEMTARIIRRCVAKIAFNYLAWALAEEERLLLRSDFDTVRSYIRDGVISDNELVFVAGGPRLTEDSRRDSLVEGHMIGLGWNMGEHILCNLSIFNAMTYQVVLSRKYGGIWFPLTNAHSFDVTNGEARALPGHILVPLQR